MRAAMLTLMTALIAGGPLAAQSGPGFDCSARLTRTEQVICDTPALAEMDGKMSALYKRILTRLPEREKAAFRRQQANWLDVRNTCRVDRRCLARVYRNRIETLDTRLAALRAAERPRVSESLELPRLDLRVVPFDPDGAVLANPGTTPPPPGGGTVTVTADGTIEKAHPDGRVSFYNPITGDEGTVMPDGTIMTIMKQEVQVDDPPALPTDYFAWSASVTESVDRLIGNVLRPDEAQTLADGAPGDFFDRLDYQLRILSFITGF